MMLAFIQFLYTGEICVEGKQNVQSLVNLAKKWKSHDKVIEKICTSPSIFMNMHNEIIQQLESDFQKMLDNSLCSDIKLKLGEDLDHVVFAHKIILCRSPYFSKMLTRYV
jgi:hypothetical protein